MRKLIRYSLLILFVLCISQTSNAQHFGKFTTGVNIGITNLTSAGADDEKVFIHLNGEAEYGVAPDLSIVGVVGYSSNAVYSLTEVTANGKYYFNPFAKVRYFSEAGLGVYAAKVDFGGVFVFATENYFGINAGVGAATTLTDKVELTGKIKYHNPFPKSGSGSLNWFNVTIGANVSL
jgi:hypothetical protein